MAEELAELLFHELAQLDEEGFDVAAPRREWDTLGLPAPTVHRRVPEEHRATVRANGAKIEALYRQVEEIGRLGPRRAGYPYDEPSTLEEIQARRPDGPRRLAVHLSPDELRDRVLGAWLGRAAGCLLGKPVEGWS